MWSINGGEDLKGWSGEHYTIHVKALNRGIFRTCNMAVNDMEAHVIMPSPWQIDNAYTAANKT